MAEQQPSRLPRAPRPAMSLRTSASMSQIGPSRAQGLAKQAGPKGPSIASGQIRHQSSTRSLRGQAGTVPAAPVSTASTAKRPLRAQPSNGDLRLSSVAPPSRTTLLRPRQSSASLLPSAERGPPTARSVSVSSSTVRPGLSQAPATGQTTAHLQPERVVRRIASAAVLSSNSRIPSPIRQQTTVSVKTGNGPPTTAAGTKRSLSTAISRQSSVLGLRSVATAASTAAATHSPLIETTIPESPLQGLVPPRRAVSNVIRPSPLSREAVPLAGSPFGAPTVLRAVSTQKLRSGPLSALKATPAVKPSGLQPDKNLAKQVSFQPSPRVLSQTRAPGSRLRSQQAPPRTSPSNDAGLSTPAAARTPATSRTNRTVPDTPALPQLLAAASRAHLLESSHCGMIKDAELSFSSDLSDSTSPASPLKAARPPVGASGMEKQLVQLRRERDAAVERAVRAERQVAELSRQAKVANASKLWAEVERGAKRELVEAEAWLRMIRLHKERLAAGAAGDERSTVR